MQTARSLPIIQCHSGEFSQKRMRVQPEPPIPIRYATAAIPTLAPFGTDYTPEHTMKIIGGRRIVVPRSIAAIPKIFPASFIRRP
ncbi:unnamed protein product [Rotaria socialis]